MPTVADLVRTAAHAGVITHKLCTFKGYMFEGLGAPLQFLPMTSQLVSIFGIKVQNFVDQRSHLWN